MPFFLGGGGWPVSVVPQEGRTDGEEESHSI